jgi:hypothetical protein
VTLTVDDGDTTASDTADLIWDDDGAGFDSDPDCAH